MLTQPASLLGLLGLFSVAAAVLICLNAEPIGVWLGVMDHPDDVRKRHTQATPLVGGIAILVPLLIWLAGVLLVGAAPDIHLFSALMLCAAGVGVVGFADDQTPTSPLSRILSLIVFLAVAFAVDPELIARNLNWGSFDPTPVPGWLFCVLMAVAAVGVVNAVNMADGQNGLVSSMFVIWSACLMLLDGAAVSALAQILLGTSLIVLLFNLRGKLFLGDCGSYGVTFAFGLLMMSAYAQGRLTIETIAVWFFIPVMDCLRLLITRLLRGRSPAEPDTDHFHHRLESTLGKDFGLFAYLGSVAVSSVVAALAPRFAFVCIFALTAIYFSFAWLTDNAKPEAAATDLVTDRRRPAHHPAQTNVVQINASERAQKREQG